MTEIGGAAGFGATFPARHSARRQAPLGFRHRHAADALDVDADMEHGDRLEEPASTPWHPHRNPAPSISAGAPSNHQQGTSQRPESADMEAPMQWSRPETDAACAAWPKVGQSRRWSRPVAAAARRWVAVAKMTGTLSGCFQR